MVNALAWEQAWEAAWYPSAFFDGVHLWSSNQAVLHEIAESVGLARRHYQGQARHPHYDAWGKPARKLLARQDVRRVTTRDLLHLMHGRLSEDLMTMSIRPRRGGSGEGQTKTEERN